MDIFFDVKTLPRALASYGSRFHGLGMGSAYLSHLLLLRANVTTGMIEGLSYRDITLMMAVDHAPGRQNAGIPKITRVRSYAQSIALALPDDFEVISEGQSLKLRFKTLPAFIKTFFAQKQDSRDTGSQHEHTDVTEKQVKNTAYYTHSETAFSGEVSKTEVGNYNSYNCNLTQLTNRDRVQKSAKQPITADFFPSQATILKAQSLGYEKVLDLNEIQAFIDYNQKYGSSFEDFNPIYLNWLKRGAEYEQKQQAREAIKAERLNNPQQKPTIAGSDNDVYRKPFKTRTKSYDELVAESEANYQRVLAETLSVYAEQRRSGFIDPELEALMALESNDSHLWQPLYSEAQCAAFQNMG